MPQRRKSPTPGAKFCSKIQWIKRKACAYPNRKRFRDAIYLHLAELDLYPDALNSTHTCVRSPNFETRPASHVAPWNVVQFAYSRHNGQPSGMQES
jgi:hypothetical protein